ncbi:MAG: DinB family protein [Cyclobacteriaceae bacterium]|nr:DinB family protein [Cyclobacteriaceae bacterium]
MANDYVTLFRHYISLTSKFTLKESLVNSTTQTVKVLDKITSDKADYSYEAGKWTIKQLISHVIDTERIMSYRALRYARKDKTMLHGFEEDDYAKNCGSQNRSLESLIQEFTTLRKSTTQLFESFTPEMLTYYGPEEQKGLTVEKIGRMIAGHSMHHCNVLVERYGI